jgi:hypothetical protein
VAVAALCATVVGCSSDFSTQRTVPPRGSVGRSLYSLVCDRVGAQALREDVTGTSFHGICHADLHGNYATNVDTSLLVPLDPHAVDVNGKVVPLEQQVKNRAYRVARIEALGRRREDHPGARCRSPCRLALDRRGRRAANTRLGERLGSELLIEEGAKMEVAAPVARAAEDVDRELMGGAACTEPIAAMARTHDRLKRRARSLEL